MSGGEHDVDEISTPVPAGPNRAQRRAMRGRRGTGVRFRYVGGPYDGQTGLLPYLVRSFKLPAEDEDGNAVKHVHERSKSTRAGVEYRFRETLPSTSDES